jgi:septation ring formation regulator EzrA
MSRTSLLEKLAKQTHDVLENSLKVIATTTELASEKLESLSDHVKDLDKKTVEYEDALEKLKGESDDAKRKIAQDKVAMLEKELKELEARFYSNLSDYDSSLLACQRAAVQTRSSFEAYRLAHQPHLDSLRTKPAPKISDSSTNGHSQPT